MPHLGLTSKTKRPSFPRKRESSPVEKLDSRFRGNDGLFGACFKKNFSILFALLFTLASTQAYSHSYHSHDSGAIQAVAAIELPAEARDTLRLIKQGGPFPYPRDGVVFGNYERQLPRQPRGYYHEYTVNTPGVRNRGARRIVCGPLPECYYSGDHYRTFQRIRE
jgi:ribonuclease T1